MSHGDIQYRCWRRPKTAMEPPSLVIRNGQYKKSLRNDKIELVFVHGKWTYSIERILSKGKYGKTSYVFLEVASEGNPPSTWKMEDLTP